MHPHYAASSIPGVMVDAELPVAVRSPEPMANLDADGASSESAMSQYVPRHGVRLTTPVTYGTLLEHKAIPGE